jgi:large subunit ribosomal protein L18e
LRKKSSELDAAIWSRVAEDLEKPTRKRRIVNLYKLNKYTKGGEIVVVPGKVLAVGDIDHPITVAAWAFSGNAAEKINKKGKAIAINDLIKDSPKGKKIRIIG